MMKRHAFTLIELLVVVAIIAILAAIAVPNLLHAQTRAKVSRVKADLRTLATALEAYTVDYTVPPLDWNVGRGDPMIEGMATSTSGILHPGYATASGVMPGLTTPVAYISNCWMTDPFVGSADYQSIPFDEQKYTYNWFSPSPNRHAEANPDYLLRGYDEYYGAWRLGSIGPDRAYYNGRSEIFSASIIYDPTNGTTSVGNIWRSQKESEVTFRPIADDWLDP